MSEKDEPMYDVVICNLLTGVVSSIAGFGVYLEGVAERQTAEQIVVQLERTLKDTMGYEIVESGSAKRGDVIPMSELREARIKTVGEREQRIYRLNGPRTGYSRIQQQRMADCQCVDCGSPDLATQARCLPCSVIYNARPWASKRGPRNENSPI